ncbi:unnamed protein product [Cyclocybe aegerita]|uniref:ARID domain-containing protein n=1 Tax=Cyclocybe aegerita TaxID=1973307 RepID=A0A8S0X468_CYCAE|nr:unnamed protein product [Cyclocybe aegerita]
MGDMACLSLLNLEPHLPDIVLNISGTMVPQNPHQRPTPQQIQQSGLPAFMGPGPGALDSSSFFDSPQAAKQMAALAVANQARLGIASQNTRLPPQTPPGGTSSGSYLGAINSHNFPQGSHDLLNSSANGHANFQMNSNYGIPQRPGSAANSSFLDPTMAQPNIPRNQPPPNSLKHRQQGFLTGLANVFAKRGQPLPPSLTGIASPNYDPTTSPWSLIESSEVGTFKLAGKDVNLFKLWGLVFQQGGGAAVTNMNGWQALLPHFDLPDEFPTVQANNSSSVAVMLHQYYMAILHPFEIIYKKNMQDQQKKAHLPQGGLSDQQQFGRPAPGMPNMQQPGMRPMNPNSLMSQSIPPGNGLGQYPELSQHRPPVQNPHQMGMVDTHNSMAHSELNSLGHTVDSNLLDQDNQGIKRKHDQDDRDTKRVRQKTDPPDANSMIIGMAPDGAGGTQLRPNSQTTSAVPGPGRRLQQPLRRKIEYVPLAREAETYGGRDLQAIEAEWSNAIPRRPLREINDWGVVDIDCLSMSIRSRLSIELSYALTTLTVLSTMRGQTPGSGFPIFQCPDLLDDILDLLEELAFDGKLDVLPHQESGTTSTKIFTNRELAATVHDTEGCPFASLKQHQGAKDPDLGPKQRPANVILAVVNILRNLSVIPDNVDFISNHPRILDILLRLCAVEQIDDLPPSAAAKSISLADLLVIRRETMNALMAISPLVNFSGTTPSLTTLRIVRRAFDLVASYLVDVNDALPPLASVQLAGIPPNPHLKPPVLADVALEVFTKLSQNDGNRQTITRAVATDSLWLLLTSLVHRLPIIDADFLLLQREYWLSFLEKTVMAIYSIIFLAPYELKQKVKTDRRLGFKNVLLRMAQRVLMMPGHERGTFLVPARRAVETIKLLDKAEDSTDKSEPSVPVLSFGMGFSDGSDSNIEKGTGLLGGNRDVAWEMLMMREVLQDDVLFSELDSLVRVERQ